MKEIQMPVIKNIKTISTADCKMVTLNFKPVHIAFKTQEELDHFIEACLKENNHLSYTTTTTTEKSSTFNQDKQLRTETKYTP